jgi:hypothetical protein
MPIRLEIHTESVSEFDELIARFARSGAVAASAIMPEIARTPAAQEAAAAAEPAPKGNARSRRKTEDASAATAASSTPATTQDNGGQTSDSGPTATSTASPSDAAVDPFAAPETTATPSATSPAAEAAADAGEVTIQQLKDAMADLLKAKSASFAMQMLEQATGCKSLTSGVPNVVEKAKDDPSIMRRTLDALVAAKSAA